jgi:glycosyltransferase involved in cell wall biosynthesis
MKVLFLMFVFPDISISFNMYTSLVEEFVAKGHEVLVVAPSERHTRITKELSITVLRVKTMPIKNIPNYLKGISNLLLPYQFEWALNKFYSKTHFDLIVTSTPPITLVDLAAKLKKRFRAHLYLILRDIFPQNAVDLGFIKNDGLLHRYFRKKEKKLYKEADYIGCMSQGNIEYIHSHNPEVEFKKLHELKNFQKLYEDNGLNYEKLREKYALKDKFVVVFGGNMGRPQQLENVLSLAESGLMYHDILFLLIGEGLQMDSLVKLMVKKKLSNIIIRPTIPKQEYQDLISICNVGLISLHISFTIPNIPSKALDYLNVGIPILASLDKATDFGILLQENKMGLWAFADNSNELFNKLLELYHDKSLREMMGRNGKIYFQKNLLPRMAYTTIMERFDKNCKI